MQYILTHSFELFVAVKKIELPLNNFRALGIRFEYSLSLNAYTYTYIHIFIQIHANIQTLV